MEIDKVYDDDSDALLPTEMLPPSSASQFLDSFWISKSSPSFQGDSASGSTNMVKFHNSPHENAGLGGLTPPMEKEESGNDDYDPCFHQPEKKRRLTIDQVKFLEKSFEIENKLEPDRKLQLAKDLGLQPRQVAIWFQNRRARFKTKQLEKDYDSLKESYDELKVEYDSLSKDNEKLRLEVESLRQKTPIVEKKLELHNTSSVGPEPTQIPYSSPISHLISANVMTIKQEDANSAKSDVVDSESPHSADANHVSLFEPVDSSRVLEPDLSDFSQDEDDESCRILPASCLPKLKIESYDDLTADTCNLGTSVDEQTFWFWS
ncbi:hypothetical protein AgCh_019588 [Apium graveolens]